MHEYKVQWTTIYCNWTRFTGRLSSWLCLQFCARTCTYIDGQIFPNPMFLEFCRSRLHIFQNKILKSVKCASKVQIGRCWKYFAMWQKSQVTGLPGLALLSPVIGFLCPELRPTHRTWNNGQTVQILSGWPLASWCRDSWGWRCLIHNNNVPVRARGMKMSQMTENARLSGWNVK